MHLRTLCTLVSMCCLRAYVRKCMHTAVTFLIGDCNTLSSAAHSNTHIHIYTRHMHDHPSCRFEVRSACKLKTNHVIHACPLHKPEVTLFVCVCVCARAMHQQIRGNVRPIPCDGPVKGTDTPLCVARKAMAQALQVKLIKKT